MFEGGAPVVDLYADDLTFADLLEATRVTFEGNTGSNKRYMFAGGKIAPAIYQALKQSVDYAATHSVEETRQWVVATIDSVDGLEVQYFSIVDGETLANVSTWDAAPHIVGCITVFCGATPIRLIDHIRYV